LCNIKLLTLVSLTGVRYNVRYHRKEREAGCFNRIIALPGDVEVDNVEAGLVGGVLTVTIPKAEVAKLKQITAK
jgi:HSP20 family protein